MEKQVEHEGIVASICGSSMVVRVVASSACAGCDSKANCISFGSNQKDIHIENFTGNYESGERVKVVMQQSLGFRALCFGYAIPCVATLTTLIVAYQITGNELVSDYRHC